MGYREDRDLTFKIAHYRRILKLQTMQHIVTAVRDVCVFVCIRDANTLLRIRLMR